VERVENFASYLMTNPVEIQEILEHLHLKTFKDDNSSFVALTERNSQSEVFILGSSGLDHDSLVGLSWLRTSTHFPTIDCLNSGKEVYLDSRQSWLQRYPKSALFREKMGIEEILCHPITWHSSSRYCLSLAFGPQSGSGSHDLDFLRSIARLFQSYLSTTQDRKEQVAKEPKASMRRRIESLAPRQQETVELVIKGLNNQEIADHLGLSVNTVKSDLKKIFKELGVSYRSQIYAEILGEE
jgi:RNA polymerase sigma factor (sigma-70 family)